MKKIIFFFIILLTSTVFFSKELLTIVLVKKISHWTEYEGKFDISKYDFINGILEINQIELKNTNGFFYKNIFESKKIIIDFDYKSLFSDLVIINKMTLVEPKTYLKINEKDLKEKDKKIKIIEGLNLSETSSKKEIPKIYPPKKKDKNFLISNLLILNARAFIKSSKKEEDLNIKLSKMSFRDVGNAGKKNNQNFQHFKDVFKIILADIYLRIPDNNLRNLIRKNYKIR